MLYAIGDIVRGGVPEHVSQRVRRLDVLRRLADDYRQFRFVIGLVLRVREQDRFAGADDRGRRLHEHHRLLRKFGDTAFFGMERVVEADADDLAGIERREQLGVEHVAHFGALGEAAKEIAIRGEQGVALDDAKRGSAFGAVANDVHGLSCFSLITTIGPS